MLSIGPGNAEYVLVSNGQRKIDEKKHRAMKQGGYLELIPDGEYKRTWREGKQ